MTEKRRFEKKDLEMITKRARRRLVGAFAFAFIMLIVSFWLFKQEPSTQVDPLKVFMTGGAAVTEETSNSRSALASGSSVQALLGSAEQKQTSGSVAQPVVSQAPKSQEVAYYVFLSAYNDQAIARSKLVAVRKIVSPANLLEQTLKTEKVWRVRVGPFSTPEARNNALKKLAEHGFEGEARKMRPESSA